MFCQKWGSQNPDDSSFCSKCGNVLIKIGEVKKEEIKVPNNSPIPTAVVHRFMREVYPEIDISGDSIPAVEIYLYSH